MGNENNKINELYRKILLGTSVNGDKEKLARWLARLDVGEKDVSAEELAIEQELSRSNLHDHFFKRRKQFPFARPMLVAAAVAAVVFSTVFLFRSEMSHKHAAQLSTVYAKNTTVAGERKLITLADGSKISMNSASSIRYKTPFIGRTREVFLEGQAYFEVSHDKTRPFIVHAGKLAVQVLGTTFDIKSYSNDTEAAVTVASGKVAVRTGKDTNAYKLLPGDQLTYHYLKGKVNLTTVYPADYTTWQNGTAVFRAKELHEICKQLERIYGVTITIKTPSLGAKKLNFKVKNENITAVIKMLSIVGDFKYSIKDRKISLWK